VLSSDHVSVEEADFQSGTDVPNLELINPNFRGKSTKTVDVSYI